MTQTKVQEPKEPIIEQQVAYLAKIETGGGLSPTAFEPETLADVMRLADVIARSELAPPAARNKPGDVLLLLMRGRELGLTVLQSLHSLHIINGKVGMDAALIVGRVRSSKVCRYFHLIESTDERATYETYREGDPEPTSIPFTLEDARRAGLMGKDNWTKHTKDMLRARAKTKLARAVYEDIVGGYYTPDELEDLPAEPREAIPFRRLEPKPENKLDAIVAATRGKAEPEGEEPIDGDAVVNFIRLAAEHGLDELGLRELVAKLYDGTTLEALPVFLAGDLVTRLGAL